MTAAPVLSSTVKFKVTVSSGKNPGQSFVFDKQSITIGRGPENDLVFSNDSRMSRNHLEIRVQGGQLFVRNISQRNHVMVNNEKVEDTRLEDGESFIQIGGTLLQVGLEPGSAVASAAGSNDDRTIAVSSASSPAQASDSTRSVLVPTSADPLPNRSSGKAPPPAPPMSSRYKDDPPARAVKPQAVAKVPAPTPTPKPSAPPKMAAVASSDAPLFIPDPTPISVMPTSAMPSPAYAAPPPPPPSRSMPAVASGGNSRMRFYIIIAVVGAAVAYLLLDDGAKKKAEVNIRTEGDVSRAIEESARAVQEIQRKQSSAGQDTAQYKAAQEHYIRGFRDYRQGQYARSMQSFQAALSFYPSHELARKYYVQAQRKFEAQVDFAMSQGRKYYQKNNYRMCQSSFANVMIMVKDPSRPKYKEAKQLYDECSLRLDGRF